MVDDINKELNDLGDEIENDLQSLWNDISERKEEASVKAPSKRKSKHPVTKVKRQLGFKIVYFAIGIVLLIGMNFATDNSTSRLLFGIINVSFIICGIYLYIVWRSLPNGVEVTANLKEAVTRTYYSTRRALRIEEGLGLCLYPLSAAAGLLWGRELRDPDFVPDATMDWWTLLIVVAVVTPLAHFAAVWLNKLAFGKYLKHLKDLMAQFED